MTTRTLRYLFAALTLAGCGLIFVSQAAARGPLYRPSRVPKYSFSVEDESGEPLPTFEQGGGKFLLGEPGLRYNIRVRNPTGSRVEAVVSVDGRDAVSGKPGDYQHQRGYVIAPYGSVLVEGFRRSYEAVAAFRFTNPEDSYSSRMGTPENVGVIGVAFFPERARPRPPPALPVAAPIPYEGDRSERGRAGSRGRLQRLAPSEPEKRRADAPAPSSAAAPARAASREAAKGCCEDRDDRDSSDSVNNLGTEFGETRASVVSAVAFQRASVTQPALISTLRYDDADGLSARGIDVSRYFEPRTVSRADEPEPFPISRFAEPPPPR